MSIFQVWCENNPSGDDRHTCPKCEARSEEMALKGLSALLPRRPRTYGGTQVMSEPTCKSCVSAIRHEVPGRYHCTRFPTTREPKGEVVQAYQLCPNYRPAAPAPTEPVTLTVPFEEIRDEALKDPEVAAAYHAAKDEPVTPTEAEPSVNDKRIANRIIVEQSRASSWEGIERAIVAALAVTRADEREKCAAQLRDYAERQADDVVAIRAATWEEAAQVARKYATDVRLGAGRAIAANIAAALEARAKGGR